jgi:hypothetical protein
VLVQDVDGDGCALLLHVGKGSVGLRREDCGEVFSRLKVGESIVMPRLRVTGILLEGFFEETVDLI